MTVSNTLIVDIIGCSSCTLDHYNIEIKKMKTPIIQKGYTYTHATVCPETGKVIIVRHGEE